MSKKRIITYGTFDLFHIGHVRLFERLAALGGDLTVCVSTDEFNAQKGKKAIIPYEDRIEMIKACKFVDRVLPETSWEQKRDDIISQNIDIFAMGDDWAGEFDELNDVCEVVYLTRTKGVCSSSIRQQIETPQDTPRLLQQEIQTLIQHNRLSKTHYKPLMTRLQKLKDPKDFDWLQAWVLLHCKLKKKAFMTQKFISRFSRQARRKNKFKIYQTFITYLVEDLDLNLPNGSSYTTSFSKTDLSVVKRECRKVVSNLEKEGLTIFANSGTLLGLVREGDFLRHDNDIDFAVLLKARSEAEASIEWLALCDHLINNGMAKSRSEWSHVTLKLNDIFGFTVDLFPAWIARDEQIYIYPHTYGTVKQSKLFPFEKHHETGLNIPFSAESILTSNYGKTWDVSDDGWTFDWPKAKSNFSKFTNALLSKPHVKHQHYCQMNL